MLRWLQCVASVFTLFILYGLAAQFFFEKRFFQRDLEAHEILIFLAGVVFAWTLVAIFKPWMRFVGTLISRK